MANSARIAIPLGLALIAGAFVTLGIQGDLLPRLMRNSPTLVVVAFGLGVFGVVVPLFGLMMKGRLRQYCFALGALLLLAGTVVAIWAAVSGTGIREQPTVTIVAKAETSTSTPPTPGSATAQKSAPVTSTRLAPSESSTTVQITASALSLASRDRMLLRVVGYPVSTSLEDVNRNCFDTRGVDVDPSAGGTVLFWGETGPTVTGSGTSSVVLNASQDTYRHLCAVAILSAKSNASKSEATRVIVDLRNLAPLPVDH